MMHFLSVPPPGHLHPAHHQLARHGLQGNLLCPWVGSQMLPWNNGKFYYKIIFVASSENVPIAYLTMDLIRVHLKSKNGSSNPNAVMNHNTSTISYQPCSSSIITGGNKPSAWSSRRGQAASGRSSKMSSKLLKSRSKFGSLKSSLKRQEGFFQVNNFLL